jgi:hypothetical protein
VRVLLVSVLLAGCSGSSSDPAGLVGSTPHGSVRIQLGDTQGSLPSTHARANQVSVAFYDAPSAARAINIGGWIPEGGGSFAKSWQLLLDLFGEPTTGKVFPLVLDAGRPSSAPDTASILFADESSPQRDWIAISGSVTVQSLAALRATFSLDAVTLVPYEATGAVIDGPTVTMDGTVTITNINNACDCID